MAYLSSSEVARLVEEARTAKTHASQTPSVSFATLYEAFSPILASYIHGQTYLSYDETEDILQEAFFSGWKHLESLQDSEKFLQWMISIVKNELFAFLRTKESAQKVENALLSLNAATFDLYEEHDNEMVELIKLLPIDEQTLVLKKCVYEYSFKEIAAQHNAKESRIKMRYYRALEKIKCAHEALNES